MLLRLAAVVAVTVFFVPRTTAATPPAGFEDHTLVDGGSSSGAVGPDGIAYEPGSGALFVLEKGNGSASGSARVRRRNPATGAVTTSLTINCLDSVGERGLLGIAFDPDYLVGGNVNRYVYLYYTRAVSAGACAVSGLPNGSYNSIVRYQESGGLLTGEQVLLRGPKLGADSHNGGTVRFAPDKTLYISMGDNSTGGDPQPAARNMGDLRGKILRVNRDGTIPPDNPFVGSGGTRPEIWAWGLRNPFRMQFDAVTGNLILADVGEDTWEEIDAGIAGADYGWPCYEGNLPRVACSPAPNGDVKPIYTYDHTQGFCAIGGPVYRASAFPVEYDGAYFFGDYVGNWIKRGRFAADGTLIDVESFLTNAVGVVDMAVSPSGCLTWVSNGAEVRETCYVGGANGQPQAVATASPTSGLSPLSVQFVGTGSTDPDQDPLSYSWAFGDATSSTQASPLKTYNSPGVRMATLTVNDGRGAVNSTDAAAPIRIVVGNRSPVGTITTPAAGAHYNAGDTISYSGTATDPEDGALPSSAYSWTVVFHHGAHTHPFLGPIVGTTSGSFTIPASGEEAVNVYYQLILNVTDSGAPLGSVGKITKESHVDILPNLTTVTVAAAPAGAGLQLAIDQILGPAPQSIPSVVNFPRTITAPSPQTIGASTWAFVSWSDAGAAEHAVAAPPTATTYTATYQCTAGCSFAPSLTASRVSTETARLQWGSLACAGAYDVVRGGLSALRSGAGNFTPATLACVANNLSGTTVDDPTPTAAGGFWYLVRGTGCPGGAGTYDENSSVPLAGSRDAEIAASAAACP
jgi:glucose/arabinose dehydrogenase/PKD repeat protein